jgi:hypothetical protein
MFYLPSFAERDRQAKAHRATALAKVPASMLPKARALGSELSASILLERRTSGGGRKARAPAHWTCAEFPPVIHSREITGNAEPFSQQIQNVSRF